MMADARWQVHRRLASTTEIAVQMCNLYGATSANVRNAKQTRQSYSNFGRSGWELLGPERNGRSIWATYVDEFSTQQKQRGLLYLYLY